MKYYLVAGEASGDLHGSNLIKALKQRDPKAAFRGLGGDLMQQAGATLFQHFEAISYMGFVEVVKHLRTILKSIDNCKKDIEDYRPDVLILIDFPGYNLRLAAWAKQTGIRVFYYISPQIWAWKERRIKQIKRDVDEMFVILPFEKEFYQKHDRNVHYVGHPLLDVVENRSKNDRFLVENSLSQKPIIALLPGSRKQEIQNMLGYFLMAVPYFENYQFIIAGAPSQSLDFYDEVIVKFNEKRVLKGEQPVLGVKVISNQTYDLLQNAKGALVTSGTATLETALFGVPQVVCYKGNAISYEIAKRIIKVKYISLVNLIMDEPIVKELIQYEMNIENLVKALNHILNPENRPKILTQYSSLKEKLGNRGASDMTAELMIRCLEQ